jgi:DNA-binding response OmpR family regulator
VAQTILIVDDDAGWLMLLGMMLQREGYTVKKASSGRAALETIDQAAPDMLITDYTMPGMDGFELCRGVRETRGLQFPIIVLSGRSDDEFIQRAKHFGANEVLLVPITAKVLIPRVQALLATTTETNEVNQTRATETSEVSQPGSEAETTEAKGEN